MQEKYWKYMVQLKAWIYYLQTYVENTYKWDRYINIFGAIASSSSIAAWAIWQNYAGLWAVIIAGSQVLSAVRDILPFGRRLKLLKPFIDEISSLYIKVESEWYSIAQGKLTEEEINSVLYKYKKEFVEIESKYSKEELLVENDEYLEEADIKTMQYFKNNF